MSKQTDLRKPAQTFAGEVFQWTACAIFLCGAALHLLRLLIGTERLSADFLTPLVDGAFGFIMIVSAAAGWLAFRRLEAGRGMTILYLFAVAFITVSIPIHIRSLIVWSTDLYGLFPAWASMAEIPLFLALAYLTTRFRFD